MVKNTHPDFPCEVLEIDRLILYGGHHLVAQAFDGRKPYEEETFCFSIVGKIAPWYEENNWYVCYEDGDLFVARLNMCELEPGQMRATYNDKGEIIVVPAKGDRTNA